MIWRTLKAVKQQYSTDVKGAPVSRNLVVSWFCRVSGFNLDVVVVLLAAMAHHCGERKERGD
jgi:hypothetical protein